jgi:parallel beta-helix repeat protein
VYPQAASNPGEFLLWLVHRSLWRTLSGQAPSRSARRRRPAFRRPSCRPLLEALEDRTLLSAVVVNTTLDNGDPSYNPATMVSLRDAITLVNADTTESQYVGTHGQDEIDFQIPWNDPGHVWYQDDGVGGQLTMANVTWTGTANLHADQDYRLSWWRIRLTQGLGTSEAAHPNVSDGLSWGGNLVLRIELDGSQITQNVPDGEVGAGLRPGLILAGGSSTVRGLDINGFIGGTGVGIEMTGPGGNTVQGNFIGTDISGTRLAGNPPANNLDPNVMLGGISVGGFANGKVLTTSDHNLIGTNGDGNNDRYEANVICGTAVAVSLYGSGVDQSPLGGHNVVAGNTLGTGLNGSLTYLDNGVTQYLGNTSGIGALLFAHDDVRGNFISGNILSGVVLGGGGNQLAAEYNGTIENNTITHNGHAGIIVAIKSQDCTITGNEIALNGILANTPIANAPGVWILDLLHRGIPTGISVLGNSIYGNTGLGIDLGGSVPFPPFGLDTPGINPDGVTLNDSAGHAGPNHFQDFPVLASATFVGASASPYVGRVTITGTLPGTAPNTQYRIEFFCNNDSGGVESAPTPDPTGYGQGQSYIGAAVVETDATGRIVAALDGSTVIGTDADGNATFTFSASGFGPATTCFAATATNLTTGDTSEFSANVSLPVAAASVTGTYDMTEGDSLTLQAQVIRNPGNGPLSFSWDLNSDGVFGDAAEANPTLSWPELVALGFAEGGHIGAVRVMVTDDQGNSYAPIVGDGGLSCGLFAIDAAPSVDGPTAAVAGQQLTFTLTANDPPPVDQPAGLTYAIDWDGDGTVD